MRRRTADLDHLRRVKIVDVDGRILSEEEHVEIRDRNLALVEHVEVIALLLAETKPAHPRAGAAPVEEEIRLLEEEHRVTAILRLEHEREGRVVADDQACDRVGEKADAE